MTRSSLDLCGNGYCDRASVRNLAGRRDKMLQNDEVRLRLWCEGVGSAHPWFDASSIWKPGIAHQPHIDLCCSTTPLAVKEVSIRQTKLGQRESSMLTLYPRRSMTVHGDSRLLHRPPLHWLSTSCSAS